MKTFSLASLIIIAAFAGRVSAQGPAIQLIPAAIDFGAVEVGTVVTQSLVIESVGTDPLHVFDINVNSTTYQLIHAPVPTTLFPGESLPVSVLCAPQSVGNKAAVMTVGSDALAMPVVDVFLDGTGISSGPARLVWVGNPGGEGDWSDPNHWDPPRYVPTTDAILVIDGAMTPTARLTNMPPMEELGALVVTNGAFAHLQSEDTFTMSVARLELTGGLTPSTLLLDAAGGAPITLAVTTAGAVGGSLRLNNSQLVLQGGTVDVDLTGGIHLTNGALRVEGDVTLNQGGALTGPLDLVAGTLTLSGSAQDLLVGAGALEIGAGAVAVSGNLDLSPGGTLSGSGSLSVGGGSVELAGTGSLGTLRLSGTGSQSLSVGGDITLGSVRIEPGSVTTLVSPLSADSLTIDGRLELDGQTLAVLGLSGTIAVNGALSGRGTIVGSVTVNTNGTLRAGASGPLESAGFLDIQGPLFQSPGGSLEFLITGPTAGSTHDQLRVHGASLADALDLRVESYSGNDRLDRLVLMESDTPSLPTEGLELRGLDLGGSRGLFPTLTVTQTVVSFFGIDSVVPASGAPGQTVTLHGSNFVPDPGALLVTFGSVAGRVTRATSTAIDVIVPPGATSGSIRLDMKGGRVRSDESFQVTLPVAPGDVDGDGTVDVLVSGFNAARNGHVGAGVVRLLSGLDGGRLKFFEGSNDGDYLGASLSPAGDWNGDGINDLVLGGPAMSPLGLPQAGSVFIYSGSGSNLLLRLDGPSAFERFGTSVDATTDIDGDGRIDLAVGAATASPVGFLEGGAVRFYSGADGSLIGATHGLNHGRRLGHSLAGSGSRMVVGAPAPDTEEAGRVHIFTFSGTGMTNTTTLFGDGLVGPTAEFGASVAVNSNLLAVSAPYASPGGLAEAGSVFVYTATDGAFRYRLDGASAGDRFGSSLALSPEATLVVGSPGGFSGNGRVWVYSGLAGDSFYSIDGTNEGAGLGASVSIAGDTLVVGEPFRSLSVSNAVGGVKAYDLASGLFQWEDRAPDPNGIYGVLNFLNRRLAPPSDLFSLPASPSPNQMPLFGGKADPGTLIEIYPGTGTNSSLWADVFNGVGGRGDNSWGVMHTVSNNVYTPIRSLAVDPRGQQSALSTNLLYRHDDLAPWIFLTEVLPASPTTNTQFTLVCRAETNTTVRIFEGPDCGGPPIGTLVVTNEDFTFPLVITNEGVFRFTARAQDAAGNPSDCTPPVVFVRDDTPPRVLVTRPASGEQVIEGDDLVVWATADDDALIIRVDVDLSRDGGLSFVRIGEDLPGDTESYEWKVPFGFGTTTQAVVRFWAEDEAGNRGVGESVPFVIRPRLVDLSLEVTAPPVVIVGERFEYDIVVTNTGPDTAPLVVLEDRPPEIVMLDPPTPGPGLICGSTGRVVRCEAEDLTANNHRRLTLGGRVVRPASDDNVGLLFSDPDPLFRYKVPEFEFVPVRPRHVRPLRIEQDPGLVLMGPTTESNAPTSQQRVIWMSLQPGLRSPQTFFASTNETPLDLDVGDVTRDGLPDVAILLEGAAPGNPGRVNFYRQVSASTNRLQWLSTLSIPPRATSLRLGYIDTDDAADLAVTFAHEGNTNGYVQIYLNDPLSPGHYSLVSTQEVAGGVPEGLVWLDFHDDHQLPRGDRYAVYRPLVSPLLVNPGGRININTHIGGGVYVTNSIRDTAAPVRDLRVVDLNHDLLPDLVTLEHGSNTFNLYRGLPDGSHANPVSFPVGPDPRSLVVADLDRDGRTDVATANNGEGSVSIYLNRTDGGGAGYHFEPRGVDVGRTGPVDLAVGDFDLVPGADIAVIGAAGKMFNLTRAWAPETMDPVPTNHVVVAGTLVLTEAENVALPVFVVSTNPAACSQVLSFDAAGSRHNNPARSITSYTWDWGDGQQDVDVGPAPTHAFDRFGEFTVRLTVLDDNSPPKSSSTELVVRVTGGNRPPVADAGQPYVIDVGGALELDGSGSFDPDETCGDAMAAFEWDIDGDGDFGDASGIQPVLPWADLLTNVITIPTDPVDDAPVYPIQLRVRDSFGVGHTNATLLRAYINEPQPVILVPTNRVACGMPLPFDGSGSRHGHRNHDIAGFRWDFGDGVVESGPAQTHESLPHAYDRFGDFTVKLTVWDDNAPPRTNTASVVIHVDLGNQPPVALAGGPYVLGVNSNLFLNGSSSVDPDEACGDGVVQFRWDLDNDGEFDDAAGPTPVISWANVLGLGLTFPADPVSGTPSNLVHLVVTDALGLEHTNSTFLSVFDTAPIPSVRINPQPAAVDLPVRFDASPSTHAFPQLRIVEYRWDFGDGLTATGAVVNQSFTMPGRRTIQLTVTDDNDPPVSGILSVPLLVTTPPRLEIVERTPEGSARLRVLGDPGVNCELLSSTNAVLWHPWTNVVLVGGEAEVVDGRADGARRFYQAIVRSNDK